jgi:hypothetical protein
LVRHEIFTRGFTARCQLTIAAYSGTHSFQHFRNWWKPTCAAHYRLHKNSHSCWSHPSTSHAHTYSWDGEGILSPASKTFPRHFHRNNVLYAQIRRQEMLQQSYSCAGTTTNESLKQEGIDTAFALHSNHIASSNIPRRWGCWATPRNTGAAVRGRQVRSTQLAGGRGVSMATGQGARHDTDELALRTATPRCIGLHHGLPCAGPVSCLDTCVAVFYGSWLGFWPLPWRRIVYWPY